MIRIVSTEQAVALCQGALAVPEFSATAKSELLRSSLRRAITLLAPCSSADLVRFAADPLKLMGVLREDVEEALEELLTYGDILEMRRLPDDPWDAPPYVLRPAPPSFVVRSTGEVVILGVSGDHPSSLPAELAEAVKIVGPVRVLPADSGRNLPEHLKLLGLIQLSEHTWLRSPPVTAALEHLQAWSSKLASARPAHSAIEGLELIDPRQPTRFYKGRWRLPKECDDGLFVARRPQAYGASLWCIVEVRSGLPLRLLDFSAPDQFQRPCDIAWRLQAAIDAIAGNPQSFRTRLNGQEGILQFDSPLPAFAERRLSLVGAKTKLPGALFAFELPAERIASEVEALTAALWLQPINEGVA